MYSYFLAKSKEEYERGYWKLKNTAMLIKKGNDYYISILLEKIIKRPNPKKVN